MKDQLFIVVKKEFFEQIRTGEKKYEYRKNTNYWAARLIDRTYKTVLFQCGYHTNAARCLVEFKGCKYNAYGIEIKLGKILDYEKDSF